MDNIKLMCKLFNETKNINELSYNNNDEKLLLEFCLEFMYEININEYFKEERPKRIGQGKFRDQLIDRHEICVIDPENNNLVRMCEACHIIPVNEFNDYNIDNGILLGRIFHGFFDSYELSINPNTYKIELQGDALYANSIKKFNGFVIEKLKNYQGMIPYLEKHYEKFIKNENNHL
jgi:predicted restriction endonuclease